LNGGVLRYRGGVQKLSFVEVECHECGAMMLPLDALHVECFVGLPRASVAFTCRRCRRRDAAWIDARELWTIAAAGAELHVSSRPSELDEHRAPDTPLVADELIDFHYGLDRDDWFSELLH
jgi:hypothetical protein